MRFFFAFLLFVLYTQPLSAHLTIHVGPPGSGNGGSNPVSIPPTQIQDYGIVYLSENNLETTLSIVPGFFLGYRFFQNKGFYISASGGLVLSAQSSSLGVSTAFGYNRCGSWSCFNIDYRGALGAYSKGLLSSYALRVGVTFPL